MKCSVLFLCTDNAVRSQMAEVVLRDLAGESFEVASAGTAPEDIDERTRVVLQKSGFSTDGLRPKPISQIQGQSFDYVITLCDKAHNEGAKFPNVGEVIAWDFADPKPKEGLAPFEITLRELAARIKAFAIVQASADKTA